MFLHIGGDLGTLEHDSLYKELFMSGRKKEGKVEDKGLNAINKAAE
jgi:hypothetical protein